jgi:amino acid transporter
VERLSKPLGLGVLSCDGISSANYGSELILHELLPFFGLAAFSLLLPMTGVILQSTAGQVLYFLVQAGAISILFTGGNTSFSGFPFLTSFVAEDSFLPRWLSKRGHRLVFSNGIIVLTVLALALLLVVGANTNNLVPFYAIGVFTGFAMAGFGMARFHRRTREPGWRRRLVINFTCGVYTALVVVIFAVVKFTEGAWLVVAVFPVMVFLLTGSTGNTAAKPMWSRPAAPASRPIHRTSPAGPCSSW